MHSQNIKSAHKNVACKMASSIPGNQELNKNIIGNTGSATKIKHLAIFIQRKVVIKMVQCKLTIVK